MKINVQSLHFDADRRLLDFVNQKVSKLHQFDDKISVSDVILRIEKSEANDNKVAEIKLNLPGRELFAKRQCKSFEEAVDNSVEALRKQIRKYKGRTISH